LHFAILLLAFIFVALQPIATTMKTCSYCGRQYSDEVEFCAVDQQPLSGQSSAKRRVTSGTCPQCAAEDDFTPVVDVHSSFNLFAFLFGGLFAVLFQNAGRPRRVRCNRCEARFYISRAFSRFSRVIFWLLVTPGIIILGIALIKIKLIFSSH
jgi:hypothetical protein